MSSGRPKFWALHDAAILVVVVLTAINFNNEILGLGEFEPLIRRGLQFLTILIAAAYVVGSPSAFQIKRLTSATLLLFGFAGLAFLSTLWSIDKPRTISQALALAALLVVVTFHVQHRGWHHSRHVVACGYLAVCITSALLELIDPASGERWAGIAGSPTQLAQLSVMSGTLVLVGFLQSRESFFFTLVATTSCIAVIAGSQSRVAFATLLALSGIVAWLRSHPSTRAPLAVAVVASFVLAAVGGRNLLVRLVLRDGADLSELQELTGRTSIWPAAIQRITEKPWLGYGFSSGEKLWTDEVTAGLSNWNATNAHQIVLEVLISVGIPGLLIFGAILFCVAAQRRSEMFVPSVLLVVALAALGATEALVHFAAPAFVVLALVCAGSQSRSLGETQRQTSLSAVTAGVA